MCDEGRFSYKWLNRRDRLTSPMVRRSGRLVAVSWDEALSEASRQLDVAAKRGEAVFVPSPRATNEELVLFKKLAEAAGALTSDCFPDASAPDPAEKEDRLLRRKDKNPNTTGVLEMGFGPPSGGLTLKEALERVLENKVRAIYLLSPFLLGSGRPEGLVREALGRCETVVLHALAPCPEMDYASVVFPSATFVEKEGTFTNYARRVQRISKAFDPVPGAREEISVMADLFRALGCPPPAADAASALSLAASEVVSFKGLKYGTIPPLGAVLGARA